MNDRKTGTREWSEHSVNCCLGCRHGCLYCYARANATRWGRIADPADWTVERPFDQATALANRRFKGVVMFPTTHDITPLAGADLGTLEACVRTLYALLRAGNRVLIVSKPHRAVIGRLCEFLRPWRDGEQVEFRFSIGTLSEELAAFWEPGAPPIAERIDALAHAFAAGYATSVSAEPLLDCLPLAAESLVEAVEPWVRETIWIGCMNKIAQRTAWWRQPRRYEVLTDHEARIRELEAEITRLKAGYGPVNLRLIHRRLGHNPNVRWKDSIQQVLGVDAEGRPAEPGNG